MADPKYLKIISNSMEQSPSLEANSSSARQKNSLNFIKSKSSLQCSQQPATCHYPEPD